MGFRDLVNKFTAGELDPKFLSEVDFDGYRKSARRLRNVFVTPQGIATKRPGTVYEQTISADGLPLSDPERVRLIGYDYSLDEIYWITITPAGAGVQFTVYLGAAFITSAITMSYTPAQIREIRWVVDVDRIILLHKDVPPRELRRNSALVWVINVLVFQYKPTYDFTYQDDPATLPTPNVPYWSNGVTLTPNAAAATFVTASTAIFTSNHVGGLIFGNAGVFRIQTVNAAGTVATGFCVKDFTDTSAIRGDQAVVSETAWNDGAVIGVAPPGPNRGWPSHGCFYQSRLVMGNSPALTGVAFGSNVKAYSDFDDSELDDASSWGVELGVTGNDFITDIIAAKSLILLGNRGPASTSILIDTPTTPTNAFLNTQGTEGARNVDGIMLDNQVIYPDRAGNTVWSMSYEIPDTGYDVQNASILSSHLIRNPRWADIYDPDAIDGRYYLLVNGDGTLAVYNTIRDENIKAWTLAQTLGSFIDVSCVANEAKFLIRRKIGSPFGAIDTANAEYTVDSTFNAFRNVTASIDAGTSTNVMALEGDYLLIGNEIQFTQLNVTFNTPAGFDLNLTFEFLNDLGSWEEFTPTDGTTGFTVDGIITWTYDDVSNWLAQPILRTTKIYDEYPNYYWIRIKRNLITATWSLATNILTMITNTRYVIYMERFSFNEYMDCVTSGSSNNNGDISGNPVLAGQKTFFFANDFPINDFTIDISGNATITAKNAMLKMGLQCPPNITPMPLVAFMQNGVSIYEPAKADYMYIDFYQSLGITLDNKVLPNVVPGVYMTDEVPEPFSGYSKIALFKGWDPRVEFVISQSYPAPFTLRAVSYTIEVSP